MKNEIRRFLPNSNLIMACHISGVYDVNRNTILDDDNYELVRSWAESLSERNIQGVIFHNNFSVETCIKQENDCITFIKIDYNSNYNPNVYRYFIYYNFLQNYLHLFNNIFITDISDVTVVRNPFNEPCFLNNKSSLFCGDEPVKLDIEWMRNHSKHLRTVLPDYANYESSFAQETLLNCGIIGGNASLLYSFVEKLCSLHHLANYNNKTSSTGDMGVFNYLVRTQFNKYLKFGEPINTVFKMYENDRNDCWFRHK